MAYDEFLADRIRTILKRDSVSFYEKNMFGGLCIMVDDKMCCGIMFNKKKSTDTLMIRIGAQAYSNNIKKVGFQPMDFTGRPMKGYAFITPDGYDLESDLEHWISLCIAFNPIATSSKKKN